jgi:hypothetical protein
MDFYSASTALKGEKPLTGSIPAIALSGPTG